MKNTILYSHNVILIIVLLLPHPLLAQLTFQEHVIDDTLAYQLYSFQVGDIDSDDDIDLVGANRISDQGGNPYGDAILWWENDGNQNFISHVISRHFQNARYVEAIDLDSDEDLDILASSEANNAIRVWENDGNETPGFEELIIGGGFRHAFALATADFDNDDDIDIAGVGNYMTDLVIFENIGLLEFEQHIVDSSLYGIRDIVATDFDYDGDIDIFTSISLWYTKLSLFKNTNYQQLTFNETIMSTIRFWSIYLANLDRDGNQELLGGGQSGFYWFGNSENNPDEFVGNRISRGIWRGGNCNSFNAVDMDFDGDMDYVDAIRDLEVHISYVRWWENNGYQEFTAHNVYENQINSERVLAFDLDQDGDNDLITGGSHSPIKWFENELDPVADASLSGRITVEGSGETVTGAEVIFGEFKDFSDENGYYEIDTLYSLDYTVLIKAFGFANYIETDFEIESGENISNFALSPAETAPTRFSLISPDSNSYFEDEYIQLTWQSSIDTDYGDSLIYDVYVQRSQIDSFYNPRTRGLTDTFYTFQATGDSTWYWTVHARDTNSEGTWAGEVWSFVTFNVVSAEEEVSGIPQKYSIASLHPNPFNSKVKIVIGIPEQTNINAEVYDILGRQIAVLLSGNVQPGYQRISWQAEGSAGIYLLNIASTSGWKTSRKMLYLK